MSKSKKNVVAQVENNETTENVVVESKSHVIPLDGSGAETYIKELGGVSKAIRALTSLNYSRGDVAKMLNKRYQHVRNVLITPVKKVETVIVEEPKNG